MPRKPSAALTDAEAAVMAVVWRLRRASVGDVVAAMNETRAVTYSTVQTIMRILETKGYVTHDKVARAFFYAPVVDERQARRRALRHLVNRLFEGSPSLLVLNVLEDEEIDPAERDQLRKLIERAAPANERSE
jgi:BlaI family transcriptional regulator, penicillinase repressor